MTIELFDTHAHLDAPDFTDQQEAIIQRAQTAGITRIVTIGAGYGFESATRAVTLAETYQTVWAAVGVHPHDSASEFAPDRIAKLAEHARVVAIGETGLDFFRDWSPRHLQYQWFEASIEIAKKHKKPLIIHSRSAANECLEVLTRLKAAEIGGVFHCYSEDAEFAKKLTELNFLVSFPGTLTFKKADTTRAIAAAIPIQQIMLETDAPFMAPEPMRGKRCEPAYMLETAKILAQIKGLALEDLALQTTQTALNFFNIR